MHSVPGYVQSDPGNLKFKYEDINTGNEFDRFPLFGDTEKWDFGSQPEEYAYYDTTTDEVHIFTGKRGYKFVEGSGGKLLRSVTHSNGVVEAVYEGNEWRDQRSAIEFVMQKGDEKRNIGVVHINWIFTVVDHYQGNLL